MAELSSTCNSDNYNSADAAAEIQLAAKTNYAPAGAVSLPKIVAENINIKLNF